MQDVVRNCDDALSGLAGIDQSSDSMPSYLGVSTGSSEAAIDMRSKHFS